MGVQSKTRKRRYRAAQRQAAAFAEAASQPEQESTQDGPTDTTTDAEQLVTPTDSATSQQPLDSPADGSATSGEAAPKDVPEAAPEAGETGETSASTKNSATEEADNPDAFLSSAGESAPEAEWEVVESRPKKRARQTNAAAVEKVSPVYPKVAALSTARLHNFVTLEMVRTLYLYILSDSIAPQWVAVTNRFGIRKVVILYVPGIEMGMFDGTVSIDEDAEEEQKKPAGAVAKKPTALNRVDPDEYYPRKLERARLQLELAPLADMFPHVWPFLAHGEHTGNRLHSPITSLLTIPINSKSGGNKQKKAATKSFPTPVTMLVMTREVMSENDYVLHPAHVLPDQLESYHKLRKERGQSAEDGWVDTKITSLEDGNMMERDTSAGLSFGHPVLAIDCEMCITSKSTKELTRISVVDWNLNTVMDELVKPKEPVLNYLTKYSGVTAEMLKDVTTTLEDIQKRLLELITPETILVGHSLNSDLAALKLTHPFIIDTTVTFPHPRGFPMKSSLKYLASTHLKKEIQANDGTTGHDSTEDALSAMELVKLKCEKGLKFASYEANSESVFAKLSKTPRPLYMWKDSKKTEHRRSAFIDWGDGGNSLGALADVRASCSSDREVTDNVIQACESDPEAEENDFVWGRYRELEAVRGWWASGKSSDADFLRRKIVDECPGGEYGRSKTRVAVEGTVQHIKEVYEALPKFSLLMVVSGSGNPRELSRLKNQYYEFKTEYATTKWDELKTKWTDVEEQQLKAAYIQARQGCGMFVVK